MRISRHQQTECTRNVILCVHFQNLFLQQSSRNTLKMEVESFSESSTNICQLLRRHIKDFNLYQHCHEKPKFFLLLYKCSSKYLSQRQRLCYWLSSCAQKRTCFFTKSARHSCLILTKIKLAYLAKLSVSRSGLRNLLWGMGGFAEVWSTCGRYKTQCAE